MSKTQNRGRQNKKLRRVRINLTLTEEQTKKLNTYMVEVVKKLGHVPTDLKQKIFLMAFDEWFEHHGDDYAIDWNSEEE